MDLCDALPVTDWSPSTVCHAADLSEAPSSVEAELPAQEVDGCAARCVRRQEAVAIRVEEDTGETAPTTTHTHVKTVQVTVGVFVLVTEECSW